MAHIDEMERRQLELDKASKTQRRRRSGSSVHFAPVPVVIPDSEDHLRRMGTAAEVDPGHPSD